MRVYLEHYLERKDPHYGRKCSVFAIDRKCRYSFSGFGSHGRAWDSLHHPNYLHSPTLLVDYADCYTFWRPWGGREFYKFRCERKAELVAIMLMLKFIGFLAFAPGACFDLLRVITGTSKNVNRRSEGNRESLPDGQPWAFVHFVVGFLSRTRLLSWP